VGGISGAGVIIGVQLAHRLPKVHLIDGIVAFERRHGLMPRDGYDAEVGNPSAPSIGDKRVMKVMERGIFHGGLAAGPHKRMGDA
jgi:hypothetical protein